jgi:hypothetical protein
VRFHVIEQQTSNGAQCPVRVVEQKTGREVGWINRYLDREYVRRLADKTLRIYALNLLHFVRWWERLHHTGDIAEGVLTESTLLDYMRFQSGLEPRPAGVTINARVAVADRAHPQPVSRLSLPDRSRLSPILFTPETHGPRPAAFGDQSVASQDAQTCHRAPVD